MTNEVAIDYTKFVIDQQTRDMEELAQSDDFHLKSATRLSCSTQHMGKSGLELDIKDTSLFLLCSLIKSELETSIRDNPTTQTLLASSDAPQSEVTAPYESSGTPQSKATASNRSSGASASEV